MTAPGGRLPETLEQPRHWMAQAALKSNVRWTTQAKWSLSNGSFLKHLTNRNVKLSCIATAAKKVFRECAGQSVPFYKTNTYRHGCKLEVKALTVHTYATFLIAQDAYSAGARADFFLKNREKYLKRVFKPVFEHFEDQYLVATLGSAQQLARRSAGHSGLHPACAATRPRMPVPLAL